MTHTRIYVQLGVVLVSLVLSVMAQAKMTSSLQATLVTKKIQSETVTLTLRLSGHPGERVTVATMIPEGWTRVSGGFDGVVHVGDTMGNLVIKRGKTDTGQALVTRVTRDTGEVAEATWLRPSPAVKGNGKPSAIKASRVMTITNQDKPIRVVIPE